MNSGYELITRILFSIYSISLMFLFCYGLVQIHRVHPYLKYKEKKGSAGYRPLKVFPFVTIQLPVYNESLVIERLIDAVAQFNYPKKRFEIQVLDDSTDETTDLIVNKTNYYKASESYDISHQAKQPERLQSRCITERFAAG